MPSETAPQSPESDLTHVNFDETELTLGLPGAEFRPAEGNKVYHRPNAAKRGFHDTIDSSVGSSISEQCGSCDKAKLISSADGQKRAVMGWPPVRSYRKKTIEMNNCKYVKVAADGAPYLRKIDLEMFNSYKELFNTFRKLFISFPICCDYLEEGNILNPMKRADEYLPTYEDKDGDWMLVGDVPWKLFIESCNRIRLMKGSEANAPRTP
ncbi:auxin-responsive protein IAA4-like isoform X2 [Momordica charantia]|uniref:Auxin-responsive protein n=1 Tax=Momordica charantia TaxID=3673 RepID=A0A6J1CTX7_MOMCH|nr:auxin-responsive protein IAA4-like isoform X2 [Momordica charantia]